MLKAKDKAIVYWAFITENDDIRDWDILSLPMDSLFNRLKQNISHEKENTYLRCPAMTQNMKNTFVLLNPMESHYKIKDNNILPEGKSYLHASIERPPTLKNQLLFKIPLSLIFFTEEESLPFKQTAPYFEHTPHLQYGALVPGTFDIGKWFRNTNIEIQVWKDIEEFHLNFEEPIAYFNFDTPKQVELQRFYYTPRLDRLNNCFTSSSKWEPLKPLSWRYMRFEKSNVKQVIMHEIRNNLIK
jgi:hypothetical protein